MHVRGLCDVGGEKIEESFFSDQKTATNTQKGKTRRGWLRKIPERLGSKLREPDVMDDLELLSNGDEVPCFGDMLLS